jgi:hypothetical protein
VAQPAAFASRARRGVGLALTALLVSGVAVAHAAPSERHTTLNPPTRAAAAYPSARISGPVTGGRHHRPYDASLVNLSPWGYREQEYFASGVATGGGSSAIPTPTTSSGPAAYRTRILVRRPVNPARFNGTVLVEWFNVTSQQDYDADWSEGYREILRGGYAYVGVSAQQQGVRTLQAWDPVRYHSLRHPGDGYADSIYAQILRAVRAPRGTNPLAGLTVRHVIADGHSQSGVDLHAFVDNVQRRVHLADGFLIRGDATTHFDVAHLQTPVLEYQSEAEIDGSVAAVQRRGQSSAPAKDSAFYRLWQVAGATHTGSEGGYYLIDSTRWNYLNDHAQWDENAQGRYDGSGAKTCVSSIGLGALDEFPQWYTLDAAIHALNAWVTTGNAPASAPRIAGSSSGRVLRDGHGNARGGVRDPVVDVPIATYHGDEGCPLSGVTRSFTKVVLHRLYPTHAAYVDAMQRAIAVDEQSGWLLPYDGADLLSRAERQAV